VVLILVIAHCIIISQVLHVLLAIQHVLHVQDQLLTSVHRVTQVSL
jgi:hypothetical protein